MFCLIVRAHIFFYYLFYKFIQYNGLTMLFIFVVFSIQTNYILYDLLLLSNYHDNAHMICYLFTVWNGKKVTCYIVVSG